MRKTFPNKVPSHFRHVISSYGNTIMVIANEADLPFSWGQPLGYEVRDIVSWSESLLWRPKATKNGWMELISVSNEHKRVLVLWPLRLRTKFYLHLYVQFLMNARSSFRFSASISKVIWWLIKNVWQSPRRGIFVCKRFIYRKYEFKIPRTYIEWNILV